jgi:hypothetical protein
MEKKIFRVYAHDTTETDYPCSDLFYLAESKEQLRKDLDEMHEGTVVIDDIVEYSLDATIDLLNLYID